MSWYVTLSIIALFLAIRFAIRNKNLRKRVIDVESSETELKEKLAQLSAIEEKLKIELELLKKFKPIADLELEIEKAQSIKYQLEIEARKILDDARVASYQKGQEAHTLFVKTISDAKDEATKIIVQARSDAEALAGAALDAKENYEQYKKVAQALKNKIDGYGDIYIVPSSSFLDTIAEQYAFSDVGQELIKTRQLAKEMVKSRRAATCEYVDKSRKDTAINFVVDAFNGKVDSILSRVKTTNAGILEQEIRDAATLVNFNGTAFRNAQIGKLYVDTRILELKLAVAVLVIKQRDQEEQRRVREQIREEEKANRDFERALRETAKEEERLKKAIEKIRLETQKADQAQREKYELQLRELSERLKSAEESNKRTQSMAQQTKSGHVYVISNIGSLGEDVIKIGMTRRLEPFERIRELGDASVPFPFDVHAVLFSDDAPALERKLHKHFLANQVNRVNFRKEFFRVSISEVKQAIEEKGVKGSWTLAALAREYRESLAIEETMRRDKSAKAAWEMRGSEMIMINSANSNENFSPSYANEVIA